jgi:iron(III) transport system substrate-binding protein
MYGKLVARILAVGVSVLGLVSAAHAQSDWDKVVEAAKKEGTLTFYNAQAGWPQPVAAAEAFEKKYGIKVNMLQVRGAEMIERIRVEVTNNQKTGDVVMMGSTGIVPLADYKVLASHGGLPHAAKLKLKPWTSEEIPVFSVTYGVVLNTNMVPAGQEPKSWKDLTDPKWKGKILVDEMTVPSGGQSWFAVMLDAFGEDFHKDMAKQDFQYDRATNNRAKRVARGEFAFALPFNLSELADLKGLPVKGVVPAEGSPYTPIGVAMIKGASHPNAARLFMDYLISPEGQLHFALGGLSISTTGIEDKVPEDMHWRVFPKLMGHADMAKQPQRLGLAGEIYNRK